jgi:hypothetical protein
MAKTVVHSTAEEKRPVNLIVLVEETGETVDERKTYYDLAGPSWSGYASNMNNILAEAHRLLQATRSFLRLRKYKHDWYGMLYSKSSGHGQSVELHASDTGEYWQHYITSH